MSGGGIPLGMVIYAAVKPIFKIYFIIAIGFYLAKRNILSVPTCRDISDAIVSAIMPCLIFNNIVSNLKSSDIKNLGIIFFEGTLLFSLGLMLAYIVSLITNCPKRWLGGLLSVGLFPNISDLPIAYMQTLSKGGRIFSATEGNKGVAYVCIFLASQVFYQFSLGLYQLVEWDFRDEIKGENYNDDENQNSSLTEKESNQNNSTTPNEEDDEQTSISSSDLNQQPNPVNIEKTESPPANDLENSQHRAFLRQHELLKNNSNPRSSISMNSGESISSHSSQPQPQTQTHTSSRRRNSQTSSNTNYYSLNPVNSRAVDLRTQKSQDIQDVINEYSEFERLRTNQVRQNVTGTSDVGIEPIDLVNDSQSLQSSHHETKGAKFKRHAIRVLKNFAAPNSASLIISIIIAMAPPLKALFVPSNKVHIHPAPDEQPPLSFIIDLTSYVGNASVPLGLLLLGATISRLKVRAMPPGFWKTALAITATRLIILPIIGVGLTTGFYKGGWFGDDHLVRFISVLEFGLPNATALVYFTAFYTDPHLDDHLQMDCLAVCLICQYLILWITLPFLVTFTLKVSIGL